MKNIYATPLTDEYLQSLNGIESVEVNSFFYPALKSRMQQEYVPAYSTHRLSWTLFTLAIFIAINLFVILKTSYAKSETPGRSPVEIFAETYNLNSNSNY